MKQNKVLDVTEEDFEENIHEEAYADALNRNFMRYSKTVLLDRAIPDARDGLKPSQRRVLVAMDSLGTTPNSNRVKCARIVGDMTGKYHPHGTAAAYGTLVGMAQDFKTRYTFVDGQGNFGSFADVCAAERYTEARLSRIGQLMVQDLSDESVPYVPTYDDKLMEPVILPTSFPNLLANGCTGIAVGVATKMPPHNLKELSAVIQAKINNPDLTVNEVLHLMPGPDFPTGGVLLGQSAVKDYYENGKTINGGIQLEAVYHIEKNAKGLENIVVTEFPFDGWAERLLEQIVELINQKKIEGIVDCNDFSAGGKTEVRITVGKGENTQLILNKLLKSTCLRTVFHVNSTVVVGEKVIENAPILKLIDIFIEHRQTVLTNKFTSERDKTNARIHILEGLISVSTQIDKAIAIIRNSNDADEAIRLLVDKAIVETDEQAKAVLAITLRQLTKLEASKLLNEKEDKIKRVTWLDSILSNNKKMLKYISDEQAKLAETLGDERRTQIGVDAGKIIDEDIIPNERIIISLTKDGYIKRIPLAAYRLQKRGGVGVKGVAKREDDEASEIFVANSHDNILFFSSAGIAYLRKGYNIPEASKTSRGMHLNNLLSLRTEDNEYITNTIPLENLDNPGYLMMITHKGLIKKTPISEYKSTRKNCGITALKLREDDKLAFVSITNGSQDVFILTANGKGIRYNEDNVRPTGRNTQGVQALILANNDTIAQMFTFDASDEPDILMVTEHGYGKRSQASDFKCRAGRINKGIDAINKAGAYRNGKIIGGCIVSDDDSLLIMTTKGKIIQLPASDIRAKGRVTKGMLVIKLDDNDTVAGLAKVPDGNNVVIEEEE